MELKPRTHGIFVGATAARIAFGQGSITGPILIGDWTSDDPVVEYSCLHCREMHCYQFGYFRPEQACPPKG